MTSRQWIFIKDSMDTVQYKVERTYMEDSQDYVVCTNSTSIPSSFEIVPRHNHTTNNTISDDGTITTGGVEEDDTLEIFDDHFGCRSSSSCSSRPPPSSCEGSDVEDSDIEVVLKSPSSSESASLCSQLSINSINSNNTNNSNNGSINDNKDDKEHSCCHGNYKNIVFNVHLIGGSDLKGANEDEEDSEVEVIGRSMHCDVQSSDSYVEDVSGGGFSGIGKTPSLTGEQEDLTGKDEAVDTITVEETALCSSIESDEHCDDHCDDVAICGSVGVGYCAAGDGGLGDGEVRKYLSQNLHVTRHTTCKGFIGVRTSTVVIIICVSTTLGLYLGNHMGRSWYELYDNEEGVVVVPTHVTGHTGNDDDTDHPLTINITFKYSSSTKQTLKTVLNSFRRLQHDYDRLYAAYQDLKEKTQVKKQMLTYWRKQASEKTKDSGDLDVDGPASVKNGTSKGSGGDRLYSTVPGNRTCYHPQRVQFRKMSTDLKEQRRTSFFWKSMYEKTVERRRQQQQQKQRQQQDHHQEQKCPKYFPEYFSISKCIEKITRVLPLLDLNLTKPVADNMHRAWNQLRSHWNYRSSYPGPVDPKKVDRFRKIFVIGNVVNSAAAAAVAAVDHGNDTFEDEIRDGAAERSNEVDEEEEEEADDDEEKASDCFGEEFLAPNTTVTKDEDDQGDEELDIILPLHSVHENKNCAGQMNTSVHYSSPSPSSHSGEELVWLRRKLKQSTFLVDILKWRNRYRSKMMEQEQPEPTDLERSNRTNSEREGDEDTRTKYDEQLWILQRENKELKEGLRNTSAQVEKVRSSSREEKLVCNNSIAALRRRYRSKYRYLMRKVREEEAVKTKKKMKKLIDQMKKRYDVKVKEVLKSMQGRNKKRAERRTRQWKEKRRWKRNGKKGGTKRYSWKNMTNGRKNQNDKNITNIRSHKPLNRKFRLHGGRYAKARHHGRRKSERSSKRGHVQRDGISRSRTRKYKEKIMEYAQKYRRSVLRNAQLQAQFQRVSEERSKYLGQVEKYKTIISQYEDRIQKLLNNDKFSPPSSVLDTDLPGQHAETVSDHEQMDTEYDVSRSEEISRAMVDEEEVMGVNNIPTGNCYNDPFAKPFYNINDVYPKDLFSRNLNIQAHPGVDDRFSDEHSSSFPSTPEQKQRTVLLTPHHLDFFTFGESVSGIYASNNSRIDTDSIEVEPVASNNRIASSSNWYVRLMQEKRKNWDSDDENEDAPKESSWFWNLMKEREKIRSKENEVNWFWRMMKVRKEARTAQDDSEEVNWFLKAMRERDNLRTQDED